MIFCLRGSVRTLWSPVVVLVGLTFSLLGLVMVTMPKEPGVTQPTYVSGVVIGAGCILLGLPFVWGGARMGIVRRERCLLVRQVFGRTRTYCPEAIDGFSIREVEHHSVPLMLIQPGIALADGSEVEVTSLATYRAIPGSRRRARKAVARMSQWTGRPLV